MSKRSTSFGAAGSTTWTRLVCFFLLDSPFCKYFFHIYNNFSRRTFFPWWTKSKWGGRASAFPPFHLSSPRTPHSLPNILHWFGGGWEIYPQDSNFFFILPCGVTMGNSFFRWEKKERNWNELSGPQSGGYSFSRYEAYDCNLLTIWSKCWRGHGGCFFLFFWYSKGTFSRLWYDTLPTFLFFTILFLFLVGYPILLFIPIRILHIDFVITLC